MTQVGTALVLASLQAATLMPVVELAQHVSAAKRHFAGVTTPAGKPFGQLSTDFVTMMSPGNIDTRRRWLPRVRMWKLILSQNVDGSWAASSTTAFALEARDAAETANVKLTLLQRLRDMLSSAVEELEADHGDLAEAVVQGLRNERVEIDAAAPGTPTAAVAPPDAGDDPLTCSADAFITSMPGRLAAVKAADASVDVLRVWATLCCVSSLKRLNVSWIFGDGDIYEGPEERTIVDAGHAFVDAYAEQRPALKEALADGAILRAAKRTTRLWKRASEMRVAELRRAEPMTSQMTLSHVHRAGTEMTRAIIMGHSTFSTFLSEPLGGLQRWQSACGGASVLSARADAPACGGGASVLSARADVLIRARAPRQCSPSWSRSSSSSCW